jgi:putative intracellular protease/amidase
MQTPAVHLLVFEGYADWEPAFAVAELRRSGGLEVVTVGFTDAPVRSMGGVRVLPDRALAEVDPAAVRLLLLPGGDVWEDAAAYPHAALATLLERLVARGAPVAAICGATLAVARTGLLAERRHTSNARDYLAQMVPSHDPGDRYEDELAVRDRGVITASGLGATEFAREIFEELGVFDPADRALWYRVFKTGRLPAEAGADGAARSTGAGSS